MLYHSIEFKLDIGKPNQVNSKLYHHRRLCKFFHSNLNWLGKQCNLTHSSFLIYKHNHLIDNSNICLDLGKFYSQYHSRKLRLGRYMKDL